MFMKVVFPSHDTDIQVTTEDPVSTGWESKGLMLLVGTEHCNECGTSE